MRKSDSNFGFEVRIQKINLLLNSVSISKKINTEKEKQGKKLKRLDKTKKKIKKYKG